ncbi:YlbF family regulator [Paramaledivibacter caminithermalis]|jgi:cell fate (sporulation/competence/biofilm development) regulator YlbF (YheA/YmcA/DUF963 family)|uniref:Control of competence regulator ComK, YlbF/YmcA n=1 Tax=Paramaledivibacter caminithermalis (strain DSM 15212 / CIP 107654 / DViRD3) TaxID=1121301 RepID=A0A1M6PIP6_PARC5|nr:YlbF family regulator [Paramaledivibacter caminithermalis]SHK07797.1 Control of competence regulator ComK, YlbF/YmcA [Paramaledivibacter caminithermalis DSM 15212]
MSLESQISNLVAAIKETNEFKEFKKAKVSINEYEDLSEEIESFQEKQMKLYNMNIQDEKAKALSLELNRSFMKLSRIPEVHKLLNSGKAFNDMMFKVYKTIGDLLDSEFKK